jgi:mono/diheme cytochrome c family protein
MAKASQSRVRVRTWIIGGLCTIFLGAQFIRPELRNSRATGELKLPSQVKQILQNSCYTCHSNQTRVPWFDEVAPGYWLVTHDVKQGRKHLNFSAISKLPAAQQRAVLFEAVNEIQLGAMPLPAYRFVHPGSVVTPQQLAALKQYLKPATLNKANRNYQ